MGDGARLRSLALVFLLRGVELVVAVLAALVPRCGALVVGPRPGSAGLSKLEMADVEEIDLFRG